MTQLILNQSYRSHTSISDMESRLFLDRVRWQSESYAIDKDIIEENIAILLLGVDDPQYLHYFIYNKKFLYLLRHLPDLGKKLSLNEA